MPKLICTSTDSMLFLKRIVAVSFILVPSQLGSFGGQNLVFLIEISMKRQNLKHLTLPPPPPPPPKIDRFIIFSSCCANCTVTVPIWLVDNCTSLTSVPSNLFTKNVGFFCCVHHYCEDLSFPSQVVPIDIYNSTKPTFPIFSGY